MYSISCGIAILEQSMEDTKALFKAADTALYDAKGSGKNKINVYINKLIIVILARKKKQNSRKRLSFIYK